MNSITVRLNFISLDGSWQTETAHELRLATLHIAQSKLHLNRALAALPGDQLYVRRVLESLSVWIELATEFTQKLTVAR